MEYMLIAVAILLVALVTGISLLVGRGRRTLPCAAPENYT
jgi:fused signal recognition particle receptor